MLPAQHRLTKKTDFSLIYSRGSYATQENISIKYLSSAKQVTRIGFPVGKNFSKKAVERNRARRLLKAAANEYVPLLKPGFDIIVMIKPTGKELELQQTLINLKKIFIKANLLI